MRGLSYSLLEQEDCNVVEIVMVSRYQKITAITKKMVQRTGEIAQGLKCLLALHTANTQFNPQHHIRIP